MARRGEPDAALPVRMRPQLGKHRASCRFAFPRGRPFHGVYISQSLIGYRANRRSVTETIAGNDRRLGVAIATQNFSLHPMEIERSEVPSGLAAERPKKPAAEVD
jgi:hypothetical protein